MAPVNIIHHVHSFKCVAEMLREDEDSLWDAANELDKEYGFIWVCD